MQLPVENYILYRILIPFILIRILFNITERLGFSKIFPRPQDKNNP
tara:strand:- start:268 stop:405 length:138 start_codon:yes stop_codon:yes gene_type:complete